MGGQAGIWCLGQELVVCEVVCRLTSLVILTVATSRHHIYALAEGKRGVSLYFSRAIVAVDI